LIEIIATVENGVVRTNRDLGAIDLRDVDLGVCRHVVRNKVVAAKTAKSDDLSKLSLF
jgi:hypothetical protein